MDLSDQACQGIEAVNGSCGSAAGETAVENTVEGVINILLAIVGFAAVIMLIIGAFRYITSGGDQQAIASAKNTIIYSIVGIVVAVMAFAIVNFVLERI